MEISKAEALKEARNDSSNMHMEAGELLCAGCKSPTKDTMSEQIATSSTRLPSLDLLSSEESSRIAMHHPDEHSLVFSGYYRADFKSFTQSKYGQSVAEKISSLNLSNGTTTPQELELMKKYPNLEKLDLSGHAWDTSVLHALADFKNLKELNIGSSGVDEDTFKELSQLKSLRNLNLSMSYGGLTDESFKILSNMNNLKELDLSYVHLTPSQIPYLHNFQLEKLTIDRLKDPSHTDQSMQEIGQIKSLKELVLNNSNMTDEGLKEIARLDNLKKLEINSAFNLSDKSMDTLAQMKGLVELKISGSKLHPSAVARLRESLPNCKISTERPNDESAGTDSSLDEVRLAGTIGHEIELLSSGTSAPEEYAGKLIDQFSSMSKEQLDKTAQMLEKGVYHVKVERDLEGNVLSLSYSNTQNYWKNCLDGSLTGAVVLPIVLAVDGIEAIKHAVRDDVKIQFGKSTMQLKAANYWDITGRGILGTNKISAPYAAANALRRVG